jgi:hypothetical protein
VLTTMAAGCVKALTTYWPPPFSGLAA